MFKSDAIGRSVISFGFLTLVCLEKHGVEFPK